MRWTPMVGRNVFLRIYPFEFPGRMPISIKLNFPEKNISADHGSPSHTKFSLFRSSLSDFRRVVRFLFPIPACPSFIGKMSSTWAYNETLKSHREMVRLGLGQNIKRITTPEGHRKPKTILISLTLCQIQ